MNQFTDLMFRRQLAILLERDFRNMDRHRISPREHKFYEVSIYFLRNGKVPRWDDRKFIKKLEQRYCQLMEHYIIPVQHLN